MNDLEADAQAQLENPEELYKSLVRALRRRKGFGILFLQATSAQGRDVLTRLREELPHKNIGEIELDKNSETLFHQVRDREDVESLNALFVFGIDSVLAPYISETDTDRHLRLGAPLPRILDHLNRGRDSFLKQFPHLCFVFVVSPDSLRFFIFLARDFFSWHSGVFMFWRPEFEM